ncbi:RHS repeat-associated core domain-containing protein [Lentisphaerota bacterium WC36G]|nr:RHS repeat-associated core domain-containing protein [Lentisphaerae bacterium WC36]
MLDGNPDITNPAATDLLYSGEQFDSTLQQQYLRARYYDQNSGRFNRLDPFAGNNDDPQSLHKYTYCHSDPVNAIDPSDNMALLGLMMKTMVVGLVSSATLGSLTTIWTNDSTLGWKMFVSMLKLVATIELLILQKGASVGKAILAGTISFITKVINYATDYNATNGKKMLIGCIDALVTSALTTTLTFGLLSNELGLFRNLWKESASKVLQVLKQLVAPAAASAFYNFASQVVDIVIVKDKENFEILPIVLSFFSTLLGAGLVGHTDSLGALRLSWALSTISQQTPRIVKEVKNGKSNL